MSEQITCECGFIVNGNSQKHAEANLKIHKTSKIHKMLIKKGKEEMILNKQGGKKW